MTKTLNILIVLLLLMAVFTTVIYAGPSGQWIDAYGGATNGSSYFTTQPLGGYTEYLGNATTTYSGGTPYHIEATVDTWNWCDYYHKISSFRRTRNNMTAVTATTTAGTTQCGQHVIETYGDHRTRRYSPNTLVGGQTNTSRTIP